MHGWWVGATFFDFLSSSKDKIIVSFDKKVKLCELAVHVFVKSISYI